MAAEDSQYEVITGCYGDITPGYQEHLLADLHECLKRLAALDSIRIELQPLLDLYRSTNGGTVGVARALKEARRGRARVH